MVKRTGVVGHKSLSTKRLVVESLSDIETAIFKALLTYHFLSGSVMSISIIISLHLLVCFLNHSYLMN